MDWCLTAPSIVASPTLVIWFDVFTARTMPLYCFFISSRRRHTRFDCDWRSDVCSSDLLQEKGRVDLYLSRPVGRIRLLLSRYVAGLILSASNLVYLIGAIWIILIWKTGVVHPSFLQIGRASCRVSVYKPVLGLALLNIP